MYPLRKLKAGKFIGPSAWLLSCISFNKSLQCAHGGKNRFNWISTNPEGQWPKVGEGTETDKNFDIKTLGEVYYYWCTVWTVSNFLFLDSMLQIH